MGWKAKELPQRCQRMLWPFCPRAIYLTLLVYVRFFVKLLLIICNQEDESRPVTVAAAGRDLCAAAAVEFDEDECEVEDFVPMEIPPPMDEIQTHTLPTQQHSVSLSM